MVLAAGYFAALVALIQNAMSLLWTAIVSATILYFLAIYAVRHQLPPKPSMIVGTLSIIAGVAAFAAFAPSLLADSASEQVALFPGFALNSHYLLPLGLYLVVLGGNMGVEARAKKARETAFQEGRSWWR